MACVADSHTPMACCKRSASSRASITCRPEARATADATSVSYTWSCCAQAAQTPRARRHSWRSTERSVVSSRTADRPLCSIAAASCASTRATLLPRSATSSACSKPT
eukprot:4293404-Prymnesium_polylepis.2